MGRFFTNLLISSFSLLIYLAWQTEATKSKIENMIEASKNQRVASLKCHVCHSEMDRRCFNLTEPDYGDIFEGFSHECANEYTTCVVKKFAVTSTDGNGTTTPMRTFSLKRNCSKKCEDGCVVMGERTRLYVCSQCCTEPLCNIGSGSTSIHYGNESFQKLMPHAVMSIVSPYEEWIIEKILGHCANCYQFLLLIALQFFLIF